MANYDYIVIAITGLGALWWAAGPWWADYIYSIEPTSGTAYNAYMNILSQYE